MKLHGIVALTLKMASTLINCLCIQLIYYIYTCVCNDYVLDVLIDPQFIL